MAVVIAIIIIVGLTALDIIVTKTTATTTITAATAATCDNHYYDCFHNDPTTALLAIPTCHCDDGT